ncbi:MAG: 2-hydroxyacid dehydrogenase [Thalassobaculales bacterium]
MVVADRLPAMAARALEDAYALVDISTDRAGGLAAGRGARAAVRGGKGYFDAATIAALPELGVICTFGAGYETIDLAACRARGVAVANAPGVTDACVADLAFGLIIAAGRRIVAADRFVRAGRWPAESFPLTRRITGRRLGILGLGRIGLEIARRAAGFSMAVHYCTRQPRPALAHTWHATALELARAVDILVVACPGGPETRHLVDRAVLDALGPQGLLVNIARGSVVDEAALVAALTEGRLGAAGLDVFEAEPVVPEALLALDNVVLTPHRAGGTIDTWEDCARLLRANLDAFFAGRPVLTPVALG